jgi:hypothetical protein
MTLTRYRWMRLYRDETHTATVFAQITGDTATVRRDYPEPLLPPGDLRQTYWLRPMSGTTTYKMRWWQRKGDEITVEFVDADRYQIAFQKWPTP